MNLHGGHAPLVAKVHAIDDSGAELEVVVFHEKHQHSRYPLRDVVFVRPNTYEPEPTMGEPAATPTPTPVGGTMAPLMDKIRKRMERGADARSKAANDYTPEPEEDP